MISEYAAYSLSDLLMFSSRVYYRLFERYNAEMWPLQILALALGLAALYALVRGGPWRDRAIPAILGAMWIWVAWAFLWERFATINWPVAYIAPVFALQGVLLIIAGAFERRLPLRAEGSWAAMGGVALFAACVVLYPLIAPIMERGWMASELFGLAPDPTAIGTLALLVLAQGWRRWLLMVAPILWCAISAVTLVTMGSADYAVPALGAVAALILALGGAFAGEPRLAQRAR